MQLRVVVRVDVDEARREHRAVGVDLGLAPLVDPADLGDHLVADGDVGGVRRQAAAVDDGRAPYDEIRTAHACGSHAGTRAATRSSIP